MKTIILSEAADADLVGVYDYILEKFGLDQAISYVSGFDDPFETISQSPE